MSALDARSHFPMLEVSGDIVSTVAAFVEKLN